MRYFAIFLFSIGFVGFLSIPQAPGFEPAMNQAPLSYFGYFDEEGNKVTKLIVGEEYYINAKFFWPESYSQPYEFFAEINDDKTRRVIDRLAVRGTMTPNSELEISFSWTPKETGEFRNFSELWTIDKSTVITGVPQYDFEVVSSNDNAAQRMPGGVFLQTELFIPYLGRLDLP